MSYNANELLTFIRNEYDNRLKSGISEEQAVIFDKNDINTKFNSNNISDLLDELNEYGYIELWITGNFILKVD